MDKVTKLTAQGRLRQETGSKGIDTFQLNPMLQPIVDFGRYNEKLEVKATTLDLTGIAGTFVPYLYATGGERIKLHFVYRGATTGTASVALREQSTFEVARLSNSSSSANLVTTDGIILDEHALGMLATANGADGAITFHVIFSRISREL